MSQSMPVPSTFTLPKRLQLVERPDGVREFADPVLRGEVNSILASAGKVTAVKLNVDYTGDGDVAGVFAVNFKSGWSIAVVGEKPKGAPGSISLGIQKVWD